VHDFFSALAVQFLFCMDSTSRNVVLRLISTLDLWVGGERGLFMSVQNKKVHIRDLRIKFTC